MKRYWQAIIGQAWLDVRKAYKLETVWDWIWKVGIGLVVAVCAYLITGRLALPVLIGMGVMPLVLITGLLWKMTSACAVRDADRARHVQELNSVIESQNQTIAGVGARIEAATSVERQSAQRRFSEAARQNQLRITNLQRNHREEVARLRGELDASGGA